MRPDLRCEYVSWQGFYGLCAELYGRVRDDGYRPDGIIGIARGGYLPARVLADFFGLMNLGSLKVEHYHSTHKSRRAEIRHALAPSFAAKHVLVVDDVSDSGDTFEAALEHLERHPGVGEIRTAVLHHKTTSPYVPNYYAHRVLRWRWIIYPWALAEDLETLLRDAEPRPGTPAAVGAYLRERYDLRVPQGILAKVLPSLDR